MNQKIIKILDQKIQHNLSIVKKWQLEQIFNEMISNLVELLTEKEITEEEFYEMKFFYDEVKTNKEVINLFNIVKSLSYDESKAIDILKSQITHSFKS